MCQNINEFSSVYVWDWAMGGINCEFICAFYTNLQNQKYLLYKYELYSWFMVFKTRVIVFRTKFNKSYPNLSFINEKLR